jgi:hypothetical protein
MARHGSKFFKLDPISWRHPPAGNVVGNRPRLGAGIERGSIAAPEDF